MKKKGRPKGRPGVNKADALKSMRRTTEIVRLRLDGAEFWDVTKYYQEQQGKSDSPWFVPDGHKPLSEAQLRAYVRKADDVIIGSSKERRRKSVYKHLAKRRNLYAKAVKEGDMATALAALKDEAALRGLYPAKRIRHKHGGDDKAPPIQVENLTDEQRAERLRTLAERVRQRRAKSVDTGGTAGIGPPVGSANGTGHHGLGDMGSDPPPSPPGDVPPHEE